MSNGTALPTEAEPLLSEHLDHLAARNIRPLSIRERRYSVLRATSAAGKPVADMTRAELKEWRQGLLRLAVGTQKNEIVHVTQFLRWCVEAGHRDEDPTAALVKPRIPERLPRPLGEASIASAMAEADQPVRAWIALGAFCGLRCMEIASLSREDIVDGAEAPFLRIIGKGDKERIVPLPASVLDELVSAGLPRSGPLFTRLDGAAGAPSAGRVSERIRDHLHSCGINGTAHQLRHRFGTKLYAATRDPFLVATVMGHASTETTKGYVKLSPHSAAAGMEAISRIDASLIAMP